MAVLAGLAFAVLLRGMSRLLGAAIVAVVAITLLAFNGGWIWPWEALSILALMFTGTMFYRAEQGQYPWPRAISIGLGVFALAITAGLSWLARRNARLPDGTDPTPGLRVLSMTALVLLETGAPVQPELPYRA